MEPLDAAALTEKGCRFRTFSGGPIGGLRAARDTPSGTLGVFRFSGVSSLWPIARRSRLPTAERYRAGSLLDRPNAASRSLTYML